MGAFHSRGVYALHVFHGGARFCPGIEGGRYKGKVAEGCVHAIGCAIRQRSYNMGMGAAVFQCNIGLFSFDLTRFQKAGAGNGAIFCAVWAFTGDLCACLTVCGCWGVSGRAKLGRLLWPFMGLWRYVCEYCNTIKKKRPRKAL